MRSGAMKAVVRFARPLSRNADDARTLSGVGLEHYCVMTRTDVFEQELGGEDGNEGAPCLGNMQEGRL